MRSVTLVSCKLYLNVRLKRIRRAGNAFKHAVHVACPAAPAALSPAAAVGPAISVFITANAALSCLQGESRRPQYRRQNEKNYVPISQTDDWNILFKPHNTTKYCALHNNQS